MLKEQLSDSLLSIGLNPQTLLQFKNAAVLPPDTDWTEADSLLQSYLLTAERIVDKFTDRPYRQRTFKLSYGNIEKFFRPRNGIFWGWRLPLRPIISVGITYTLGDGTTGSYVTGTDYQLFGTTSLTPEIIFPMPFSPPATWGNSPYPWVLNVVAGGEMLEEQKTTIFELAAYYYRFPEAATLGVVPTTTMFQANLDAIRGSFL